MLAFNVCGIRKLRSKYVIAASGLTVGPTHALGWLSGSGSKLGAAAPEQVINAASFPVLEKANESQLYATRPVNTPAPPRRALPSRSIQLNPRRGDHSTCVSMKSAVFTANTLLSSESLVTG